MNQFDPQELKKLYVPPTHSHKGQNGKLLLIGGSSLFHAASLWTLTTASRLVDMVFYSSVPDNNEIVLDAKKTFRDGIVVRRSDIEDYVQEADAVLIGPGMVRKEEAFDKKRTFPNLAEIDNLADEGEQSYFLTKYLLAKYPQKKWILDAGALQMMDPEWLKNLSGNSIITPHPNEFLRVFQREATPEAVEEVAKEFNTVILLKGENDLVCSPNESVVVTGGNAGMTKGGTGDVLAGIVAGLATKNDLYLSAKAGSYINKKAGERLFEKMGYNFNATDLVNEIPLVMKELLT